MPTKGCAGFSFCLFRSWAICKKLKRPGFYTFVFYTFISGSKFKLNRKFNTKLKMCAKFQQKILNYMGVVAHESVDLFRQKTWFLGNNRGLP